MCKNARPDFLTSFFLSQPDATTSPAWDATRYTKNLGVVLEDIIKQKNLILPAQRPQTHNVPRRLVASIKYLLMIYNGISEYGEGSKK